MKSTVKMPGGKEQKERSLKRAAEKCSKLTEMFKRKSRKEISPEEETSQNSQTPPSNCRGSSDYAKLSKTY